MCFGFSAVLASNFGGIFGSNGRFKRSIAKIRSAIINLQTFQTSDLLGGGYSKCSGTYENKIAQNNFNGFDL